MMLEEIEGEQARFIPDEGSPIHVAKKNLPHNYRIGEIYEVTIEGERVLDIVPLKEETQKRLAKMKQKRVDLLNKKNENH
ncbi:DUF3006 domain-containing protein [Carnobacterium sp. ISL-102]|uniref:DUF3006 domain-containing protein n=1 Tax=Carnobacterium TaxID=2747 RepID=UPI00203614EF|nr:DUF3006 domain-containing protein [Carnobacterium sp. ISL-102]